MNLRRKFIELYEKAHKLSREVYCNKDIKNRYRNLKSHGIKVQKLSREQKREIDAIWGRVSKGKDYSTHELIYSVTGRFDPYICPIKLCASDITFKLNKAMYLKPWTDKNYFEKYFPDVRFPKAIIRNVNGVFYDEKYNVISKDNAVSLIIAYDEVCIKPTLDSGSGNSVKKIKTDHNVETVLDAYKRDFIVQEIVSQYEPLKELNPTSVNIVRIITLLLNGRASVVSSTLRCGALGAFTDNSISKSGEGMFVVGISDEGVLKDVGYYSCGTSITKSHSGADFAGLRIPNFEKAKEISLKVASQMAFAGLVGFDIAFDKDGEPIVMEYNLYAPGAYYYQLVNGPLFGERTQEVIEYLKNSF